MNHPNQNNINTRIAIVCDWIMDWGGAELVLSHLLEIFPNAGIYTSVFHQAHNPLFKDRHVYTSFLQKIPFINKRPKLIPFLRPYAFESFDFSGYDLVISSSSAEAKGIITKPETLHICYCHTPTRYFWSHYHEYRDMLEFGILNPLARIVMPLIINRLRLWDYAAAQRPDHMIANSENTARRIRKYYGRESVVIHPGVNICPPDKGGDPAEAGSGGYREAWGQKTENPYYISIGRAIPYKKFDLLVDTFNRNGKKLVIITSTDNALYRTLKARSWVNIEWKLRASEQEKSGLLSEARAFLFPPEEDFWLVPIEAMSHGTPVIAYRKWGALETVVDGKTGIFFDAQAVECLDEAISRFETMQFNHEKIREHARGFEKSVFQRKILEFVEEKMRERS